MRTALVLSLLFVFDLLLTSLAAEFDIGQAASTLIVTPSGPGLTPVKPVPARLSGSVLAADLPRLLSEQEAAWNQTTSTNDKDGDGVADNRDICADTPPALAVDPQGCPDLEAIFQKRIVGSLFHPGGAKILPENTAVLDSVVNLLRLFPAVTVVVAGYTDNLGADEANRILSEKRARAVLEFLVGRGIERHRLAAVGRGESNFIASNRTKSGRRQNRRVEIEFSYSLPKE
jgi:outer membrane protein OmpA-like peptidoglycan-associated protein